MLTLFPCNECTKAIIQSGLCGVVYLGGQDHGRGFRLGGGVIFGAGGIRLTPYGAPGRRVALEL